MIGPYGGRSFRAADWTTSGVNPVAGNYGWLYLFQGGRYDNTTAQYNFRNRDHSVTLGRPIQADPLGYPDGMNRYEWERSNPVNRLDPMGLGGVANGFGPGAGYNRDMDPNVIIGQYYREQARLERLKKARHDTDEVVEAARHVGTEAGIEYGVHKAIEHTVPVGQVGGAAIAAGAFIVTHPSKIAGAVQQNPPMTWPTTEPSSSGGDYGPTTQPTTQPSSSGGDYGP